MHIFEIGAFFIFYQGPIFIFHSLLYGSQGKICVFCATFSFFQSGNQYLKTLNKLLLVLGYPGVEFCNSVVEEHPFLDKDIALLDPGIRDSLDCIKSCLKSSNFSISFSMCGHLLCSTLGRHENLQVVDTVLVKCKNLLIQSLDLSKIRWLGETFSSSLLGTNQPGGELLDTSSVLSPELNIVGVFVALNLGVGLEVSHVFGDPGKLILEDLGISGNLVSLGQELLLCGCTSLQNFKLGCNVFLKVHSSGNSVLREHGSRGFLDIGKLSCCSIFP